MDDNLPGYEHGEAGHAEERGADVTETSLARSIGNVFRLLAAITLFGRDYGKTHSPR